MGLDMYIWRMKKVSKEEAKRMNGRKVDEIENMYSIFHIPESEENSPAVKAVIPYCQKIKAIQSYVDTDKIVKDNGIQEECYLGMTSYLGNGVNYTFYSSNRNEKLLAVTYSWDELNKKYTYEKVEDIYITHKLQEAGYWRKKYELDDAISNACAYDIKNCGYYRLTDKMLNAIRKYDRAGYTSLRATKDTLGEDEGLFYHIWY